MNFIEYMDTHLQIQELANNSETEHSRIKVTRKFPNLQYLMSVNSVFSSFLAKLDDFGLPCWEKASYLALHACS